MLFACCVLVELEKSKKELEKSYAEVKDLTEQLHNAQQSNEQQENVLTTLKGKILKGS